MVQCVSSLVSILFYLIDGRQECGRCLDMLTNASGIFFVCKSFSHFLKSTFSEPTFCPEEMDKAQKMTNPGFAFYCLIFFAEFAQSCVCSMSSESVMCPLFHLGSKTLTNQPNLPNSHDLEDKFDSSM